MKWLDKTQKKKKRMNYVKWKRANEDKRGGEIMEVKVKRHLKWERERKRDRKI